VPDLVLLAGYDTECVDTLLCPNERDGYPSRHFFSADQRASDAKLEHDLPDLREDLIYLFLEDDQPGLCLVEAVREHLEAS
jgi:hypothetical protein